MPTPSRPFAFACLLVLPCSLYLGACSASPDEDTFGEVGGASGTPSGAGGFGVGGLSVGVGVGGIGVGGAPVASCKVSEGQGDAVPECKEKAPAESFEPTVQWTWTAPPSSDGFFNGSFGVPLVGNFTDDNGDGAIDLCDIPDVIITSMDSFSTVATGRMFMLAGDTGKQELEFPIKVDGFMYPAFGDIDGDGLPEVVTADTNGNLVAFENDGTLKWTGDHGSWNDHFSSGQCPTIGLYDLDGDGKVEILAGFEVFDDQGHKLWGIPNDAQEFEGQYWCTTATAADLDGDGKLEVLFGHETYHADGTLYWKLAGVPPAHPHVANLDSDPEPEVFLTNTNGITVVEHDGTLKFGPVRPTDPNPAPNSWGKPAVVHDFDGDGIADLAAATSTDYSVYTVGPTGVTIKWTAPVQDLSGNATATAFDFLGDGVAEGIYADETNIWVFDGKTGAVDLTSPRTSATIIEYPVVADCDNDGSAEILYVSNGGAGPTLTVIGDAQNRWIRARRIWNQYSYHVTNVREDGTIPKQQKNNWQLLNTFRTNSQIGDNGDCDPAEPPK